jgi:signal transduction histidine kinase
VIAALLLLLWWGEFFSRVRLRLNDVYFVPSQATSNIVLVGIDDASFSAYGRSLTEWSRTVFADLLMVLADAEARVVTFDVLLVEGANGDEAFAEAVLEARQSEARTRTIVPVVGTQLADINATDQRIHYAAALHPPRSIREAVENAGYINVFPDADNTIRRQLTLIQSPEQEFGMSLGLATYLAYLRVPVQLFDQVLMPGDGILEITPERSIPVDSNGLWMPNYFSSTNGLGTYPVYSLLEVLTGAVDPTVFTDKIVFVGVINSAGTTDLYTVPTSPGNRLMAGVELHANAVETLIQNVPLAEQAKFSQGLMILVLALFASIVYAQLRWHLLLPVAMLLVILWIIIAFINFSFNRLVIDLFYSLLALTVPVVATLVAEIVTEIRLRQTNEFLLQSVVDVSSQQMALDRILQRVARDIRGLVATKSGAIWLRNTETSDLQPVHTWSEYGGGQNANIFSQICDRAVHSEKSVVERDQIALPVMWQGKMLGMFTVQSANGRQNGRGVSRVSLRMLDTLAQQIAPSLENAMLFAETQRQKSLLEGLLEESPAGMVVLTSDLKLRTSNAMIDQALGIVCEEFIGHEFRLLLDTAGVSTETRERLMQRLSESQPFRDQLKHQQRTFAIDAAPVAEIGEWIVVFNDVTTLAGLSELKTHMIRMASHDLNNPLASVIGNSQILLEEAVNPVSDADRREMIEYIHTSGKKMQRIIEDILSLERVRSAAVFKQAFDFREMLEMVVAEYTPDAKRKLLEINMNLDDDLPMVYGDQPQLLQALSNLIGNSIKYTPEGGLIEVRLYGLDKKLRFEVEDNGIGIPLNQQQHIFQEFFRAKTEATARISGTGLGLSLVKSVIEAHGGRVWFTSQEGEGSTFFVDLPYAAS